MAAADTISETEECCCVCFEATVNLLDPCRHLCCAACLEKLNKPLCPICRVRVVRARPSYIPPIYEPDDQPHRFQLQQAMPPHMVSSVYGITGSSTMTVAAALSGSARFDDDDDWAQLHSQMAILADITPFTDEQVHEIRQTIDPEYEARVWLQAARADRVRAATYRHQLLGRRARLPQNAPQVPAPGRQSKTGAAGFR